jgi:DNA-binding CsgD family transcriptional regulator
MTPKENRAELPNFPKWMDGTGEPEIGRPSPERTRAANEVGSAIVHQLNGPLTALRLYVGEIRAQRDQAPESAEARDDMRRMVESAFQETERLSAMMRQIADSFEGPLYPETAAAVGRDVITWWSRSGGDGAGDDRAAKAACIALLTRREREVLSHINQGLSNKQGAIQLGIGPRTFESHRARIMQKLGARNGADLVRLTLSQGR